MWNVDNQFRSYFHKGKYKLTALRTTHPNIPRLKPFTCRSPGCRKPIVPQSPPLPTQALTSMPKALREIHSNKIQLSTELDANNVSKIANAARSGT